MQSSNLEPEGDLDGSWKDIQWIRRKQGDLELGSESFSSLVGIRRHRAALSSVLVPQPDEARVWLAKSESSAA